jgi:hypothetical protein
MDHIDFISGNNSKATTPAFQCCEEIRVLIRSGISDELATRQNHVERAKPITCLALRRGWGTWTTTESEARGTDIPGIHKLEVTFRGKQAQGEI